MNLGVPVAREFVQISLLFGAFWVATLQMVRHGEREAPRLVLGLVLGALMTHVVWCLAHVSSTTLLAWLDPTRGSTLLGLPLGALLAAPWRLGPARAYDFLATSWLALTPALAIARLGCLVAGCCPGVELPVELFEALAWLIASWLLTRLPRVWVPGAFLVLFGTVRLCLAPLRVPDPHASQAIASSEVIAASWIAVAVLTLATAPRGNRPNPRAPLFTSGQPASRRAPLGAPQKGDMV